MVTRGGELEQVGCILTNLIYLWSEVLKFPPPPHVRTLDPPSMLSQEHQNLVRIASLYMQSPWGACRQTANYFSLAATWEFLLVAVAHQVHYKNNLHQPGWVSNQFFGGRMGSIDHQGQEELYLWSEVMKFRQHHPQFSPSPVHSIANHLSFHPSNHLTIHPSISTTNFYMDSSTSCPIVLFLRPGYPGTCFPMYTTMSLKLLGSHISVD